MKLILLVFFLNILAFTDVLPNPPPPPKKVVELNVIHNEDELTITIWDGFESGQVKVTCDMPSMHEICDDIIATVNLFYIDKIKNKISLIREGQLIDFHPCDPLIPGADFRMYYIFKGDKKVTIQSYSYGHIYILQNNVEIVSGIVKIIDGFLFLTDWKGSY